MRRQRTCPAAGRPVSAEVSDGPVLTCSGVNAGYVPGRPVVRNVDLSLEPGTVLALLGPNGAGKTTLMLTIAGLRAPLAGQIGLGGVPVRPGSPRAAVGPGWCSSPTTGRCSSR